MAYALSQFVPTAAPYSGNIEIDGVYEPISTASVLYFFLPTANVGTTNTGYMLALYHAAAAGVLAVVWRVTAGALVTPSVFKTTAGVDSTIARSFRLRYHATINKFEAWINGVLIFTATDSTYTINGPIAYGENGAGGYLSNLKIHGGHSGIHPENLEPYKAGSAIVIYNGDFEASASVLPPPGWEFNLGLANNSAVLSYDTITPNSGNQSLKILAAVNNSSAEVKHVRTWKAKPGDTFTLNGSVKNDGNGTSYLLLSAFDKAGGFLATLCNINTSGAWVNNTSISAACPANTVSVVLTIRVSANVGVTSTGTFDDIHLVRNAITNEIIPHAASGAVITTILAAAAKTFGAAPVPVVSTAYVRGQIVKPTVSNAGSYGFQCTTDGSTSGAQPAWTQTVGNTTTWGGAVFQNIGLMTAFSTKSAVATVTLPIDNGNSHCEFVLEGDSAISNYQPKDEINIYLYADYVNDSSLGTLLASRRLRVGVQGSLQSSAEMTGIIHRFRWVSNLTGSHVFAIVMQLINGAGGGNLAWSFNAGQLDAVDSRL